MFNDPIDNIVWIEANSLRSNSWTPNYVLMPELKLLERSILKDGWTAPITISADNEIIDGFHRWRLTLDCKAINTKYEGKCPCIILDKPAHKRKATTIRLNRARGTHAATRMAELVKGLVDDGMDPQEVMLEFGMSREEVDLLCQTDIFKARKLADYRYSRAWVPVEKK